MRETLSDALATNQAPAGLKFQTLAFAAGLLAFYFGCGIVVASKTHAGITLGGAPLFWDFSAFWEAGKLALTGRAAEAYSDTAMVGAEHAAFPGMTLKLPWNYPPTFQLLLAPFAALPYVQAWLLWSALSLGGLWGLLKSLQAPKLLLMIAPGVAINVFFGQNGLLSLLILGSGCLLLKNRPLLAGAVLGLMAFKPQLALLVPIYLCAKGAWRSLAAAALSQTVLVLFTVLLWGPAPWFSFFRKALHPSSVIVGSSSDWKAIPSFMTFFKTIGADPPLALLLHIGLAGIVAALAFLAFRKEATKEGQLAILVSGSLLLSPYLRPYDLVLVLGAVPALLRSARPHIFWPLLGLAWLLPGLIMFGPGEIQVGALAVGVLFAASALKSLKLNHRSQKIQSNNSI